MKNTAHILLIILFLATIPLMAQDESNTQEKISNALSKGNASVLAGFFNSTIDISIPGKEGTFSATQAELIMKEFLSKNKPIGYKDNHSGSSSKESVYVIGTLKSETGSYRVYYLLKKDAGNYLVHLLQISAEL